MNTLREQVESYRDALYNRSEANYNIMAEADDELIESEHRALAHLEEVIADKLATILSDTILSDTIEQPNTQTIQQESNMATKNTVKSLADSGKPYYAFVLEVRGAEKFVMGNTDSGLVRAPSTINLPVELSDGLYVLQGKANGTFNSHVQFKAEAGNRPYGWSFETNCPAVRALVG